MPQAKKTPPSPNQNHSSYNHTSDPKRAPSLQVTSLETISQSNLVPSEPSQSWETAYLFAFIFKFTSICHTLQTGLKLRIAQDLEKFLQTDTRAAESEPSEQPDDAVTEAKAILTEILTTFHNNLKTANLTSWSKWLKKFVDDTIEYEIQHPLLSILRWPQNYLSTRSNGFWDLDWFEKLHLLRILVDHQLTYSPHIRSIIDEHYDKPSSKSTKQQSATSASHKADGPKSIQNQLLIKPLGLDRNLKTWWQIDDSPRIYCSGNPYKSDCTWSILSTSQTEFTELTSKLSADPETVEQQPYNSVVQESSSDSRKVIIPSIFTSKSRKKQPLPQNLALQLEWKLSKAIGKIALSNIQAGEQRVLQLIQDKEKIKEREMRKQRKIALANSRAPLTRETPGFGVRSRLRSQLSKPDYVVDSDEIDRQLERILRASEGSGHGSSDSGREGKANKRKLKERTAESESDYPAGKLVEDDEADDTAYDSTECDRPTRKRVNGANKVASTSQGERRSTRVRTKMDIETEEEPKPIIGEEEPQTHASTWSRAKPPSSPSLSESLEKPCTNPIETTSMAAFGAMEY